MLAMYLAAVSMLVLKFTLRTCCKLSMSVNNLTTNSVWLILLMFEGIQWYHLGLARLPLQQAMTD